MQNDKIKKAKIIASNWEWLFNNEDLTNEDLQNFKKDCNEAGVTALDVYEHMSN